MAEELEMDSLFDDESLDFLKETSGEETPPGTPPEEGEENNNNAGQEEGELDDDGTGKSTPSDNTDTGNNEPDTERLTLFASALAEEGVLTLDEKTEVKSFDDLAKLVEKTIRENELKGLNEHQKEYLKALENGFSTEEFKELKSKELKVSEIKEESVKESEDLQRQLITEDFLAKGYSKEKAEKLAKRSFDLGENEADALEALESKRKLIEQETKLAEAKKQKDLENQKKTYEETVKKVKNIVFDEKSEVIPGIKYNKKVAEEVYDSIMKPAEVLEDGTQLSRAASLRSKDPYDFETKLNYLLVLTKDFTDFSVFDMKGKSDKAKEFVDKLNSKSSSKGAGGFANLGDNLEDLDWIAENL